MSQCDFMGQLQINQITQSCETEVSKAYITNLETWWSIGKTTRCYLSVRVWCMDPAIFNSLSVCKEERKTETTTMMCPHHKPRNLTASGRISVSDSRLHTQLMSLSRVLSHLDVHSMTPSL